MRSAVSPSLRLRNRLRQRQHLLMHRSALQDQHHQHQPPLNGDQFDVLEAAHIGDRRRHQRGDMRRSRQHRRHQQHPLFGGQRNRLQPIRHMRFFDTADLAVGDQALDEVAIAVFSGDASGGGVRRGDIAEFFQHRHLVTDGRRAKRQIEFLDQIFRTDRFRRIGVGADDTGENFFLPPSKFWQYRIVCIHRWNSKPVSAIYVKTR